MHIDLRKDHTVKGVPDVKINSQSKPPLPESSGSALDDAICERDAYFAEAVRTKATLAELIPALEVASKCNADKLRNTCPGNELTPDEWAALWMARAILEVESSNT